MPALNTRLKLPLGALLYSSLGALGVSVVITIGGMLLSLAAQFSCIGDGCALFSSSVIGPVVFIVVLLILSYPLLFWFLFSYELTERTITINSGILFRQYETIDFGRIQTLDNERNPVLMLLGLTEVRLWTASADQLTFSVGKEAMQTRPHPDTKLLLAKDAAEALKALIMRSKSQSSGL